MMENVKTGERVDADAVAAERIDGETCDYPECDDEADWLVEVARSRNSSTGFVCCQNCSRKNRVYAKENELYRSDVDQEIRAEYGVSGNDGGQE